MTSRALAQAVIQAPRPEEFHACNATRRSNARICSLWSLRSDAPRKARRSLSVVASMVAVDGAVKTELKSEILNGEKVPDDAPVTEAKSILSDVTNLIKLVDSKDIVELELKHKDFEVIIKKAEALAPPPAPPVAPLPYPHGFPGFAPPPAPAAASLAPAPVPEPAPAAPAAPALPAAPQYPPLLSPMAGNFYRSPGPGEAPFVKVGDKVRKGQVLCIIEAMKLMNEIECDQDGTLVEVLAEDTKPVTADAPLFVIKP